MSYSFRHGFTAHLIENGTDVRFTQRLLGHVKLETTTIYTKVAVHPRRLDSLRSLAITLHQEYDLECF
ncbi:MAG: tyrosine-type recombinase/integrase [Planctomycetes bacterium]|nr:tyrosine-type recombinase/integrase [Planctomycetota bacterium]